MSQIVRNLPTTILFENRYEVMILARADVKKDFIGDFLIRAKDIADILGYSGTDKFTKIIKEKYLILVRNSDISKPPKRVIRKLHNTGELFVTSIGLNQALAASTMSKAEPFQDWLFEEVLPSIQKHGMYAIDELLDNPDFMIQALQELKEERKARKQLETKSLMLEQRVAEYEPRISYLDQILSSKGTVTITQIAKDYGMSGQALNQILHKEKVQYKQNGQWLLYHKHHDEGYTKSDTIKIERSNGDKGAVMNTRWKQKGRLFIHGILKKRGIVPVMDRESEKKKVN